MYGFIIAACIRDFKQQESLINCLKSTNYHNPEFVKVVVVDFTSDTFLIEEVEKTFKNVIFEKETPKVPADMLLYYFFLKNHYCDIMITLQDSMYVRIPFTNLMNPEYLWHFNNHRVHWNIIKEPENDYGVITHEDLIIYCINKFIKKESVKNYCLQLYYQKEKYSCCFGTLMIMPYQVLKEFDEKTGIIEIMTNMKTNRLRRAIETIFSLCFCYYSNKYIDNSYDGLYYDGINYHNNMISKHIQKISFDRQ